MLLILFFPCIVNFDLPAPKGKNEEENMTFSLSFKAGSQIVTLNYCAW